MATSSRTARRWRRRWEITADHEAVAVFEHVSAQMGFDATTYPFRLSESGKLTISTVGVVEMKGREFDREVFTLEWAELAR